MKNCHADFIATHERPRDGQDWQRISGAFCRKFAASPVCPRVRSPLPAVVFRPCRPQAGLPDATYFLPKLRIPPKLWGGPLGPRGAPWTRFSPMKSASPIRGLAGGGVGGGPGGGGGPTINADCAVLGKVCGIGQDCLPHNYFRGITLRRALPTHRVP